MHELILGGQKSGKSRCAERRAEAWLVAPTNVATLVATGLAGDAEMQQRIARHRNDRAERVPRLATVEVPIELAQAIGEYSAPHRMVVVDCLSIWLTNLLMPIGLGVSPMSPEARHFVDALGSLHQALASLCSRVTLLVAGIELPVKREAA